jgi:hypothetical protein
MTKINVSKKKVMMNKKIRIFLMLNILSLLATKSSDIETLCLPKNFCHYCKFIAAFSAPILLLHLYSLNNIRKKKEQSKKNIEDICKNTDRVLQQSDHLSNRLKNLNNEVIELRRIIEATYTKPVETSQDKTIQLPF